MSASEEDAEECFIDLYLEMSGAVIRRAAIYRIGGEVSSFYKLLGFIDFRLL